MKEETVRFSKVDVGFQRHPPICMNCQNYEKRDSKRYCRAYGFRVYKHSICDYWIGRKGETLDDLYE